MVHERQRGFTLVELMIAVAILGILIGLLVLGFDSTTRKVRSRSEVAAVFAEFHRAQSQYALERGTYYSTGSSEDELVPSTPTKLPQAFEVPDTWKQLRIQRPSEKLACGYVTVAGNAATDIPAFAENFGMEQPPGRWYVLFARCNADGNTAVDATFFASSVDPALKFRDEGK